MLFFHIDPLPIDHQMEIRVIRHWRQAARSGAVQQTAPQQSEVTWRTVSGIASSQASRGKKVLSLRWIKVSPEVSW